MPEIFAGLTPWVAVSLVLAIAFVLAFECINGFHDTANAVATVIYTKAMPPHLAVVSSGIFNFLGVLLGGVGVAYAIVHLLPVELLIDVEPGRGLVMVFSMLLAAIIWNFGTWYLGIPASSSHTLIGAILGVGMANALLNGIPLSEGVNWGKALEIALSLVLSPIGGFVVAGLLLILLKYWAPLSKMHVTPEKRREVAEKKRPPFWNRVVLIASSMGVSFVHGSNDGQKGIGLIMLVLIGIVPAKFVLDMQATPYEIKRSYDAALALNDFYVRNGHTLGDYLALAPADRRDQLPKLYRCDPTTTMATITAVRTDMAGVTDYKDVTPETRIRIRRYLLCLDDTARKVLALPGLPSREKSDLQKLRKDLVATTEYAPFWVILAIALALGIGTMIGWKRVVTTVGEKIGKQGMTYAQGMCAQVTTVAAIGLANMYSLPVSTTHVLSSGVAGTMVANKSGLHHSTVRNIMTAWVLTLPMSMLLSAGLFWGASQFLK